MVEKKSRQFINVMYSLRFHCKCLLSKYNLMLKYFEHIPSFHAVSTLRNVAVKLQSLTHQKALYKPLRNCSFVTRPLTVLLLVTYRPMSMNEKKGQTLILRNCIPSRVSQESCVVVVFVLKYICSLPLGREYIFD